jgi:flotillin
LLYYLSKRKKVCGGIVEIFLWLLATAVVLAIGVFLINRFYMKSTRDTALIRTGAGGQRVILDGGVVVLPFLHRVDEINMRTQKLDVKRTGEKSLITEDRMRVDVEMEFQARVIPTAQGVATAAQAYGARVLRSEDLSALLSGRFIDALQATAATYTLDAIHEKRGAFTQAVRACVAQEMEQNGLLLETASITRMDQTPFTALNENNAFNAVGMRRLAEIVATNKKKRAQIESEADVSVRQTLLDAVKSKLTIDKEQQQAQIAQELELESSKAQSEAQIARTRAHATNESEQARIDRELSIKSAEIARDRSIDKEKMDAMLANEMLRVDHAIALSKKQSEEAAITADTEIAKSAVVLAQERVQTEKERAVHQRAKELALMRASQDAEVDAARVNSETQALIQRAKANADALRQRTDAEKNKAIAESEGKLALLAAENTTSDALMRMKLEMHRLDRLPEITAHMMKPIEKIDSIRINQITGMGGNSHGGSEASGTQTGNVSPVNQAFNSILDMALQYPILKRIGDTVGVDLEGGLKATLADKPSANRPTET